MNILFLKKATLPLLVLTAFLLSAWSILLSRQEQPLAANNNLNQPDAYMEGIVATIMNKQGTPSLKIEAPRMTHYVANDATYIIHPHLIVYRQSPQPWHINSDYAEAINGTSTITFSNHVVIHHPTDIENPITTMETTSLTVFPDKQQAQTQLPVIITQPDAIIHAVGMLADLNEGTVKLLSQAKGDYVPAS